ncbi:hypothetical protein Poly41_61510 [Novipirellula artificiosorum]|uniref:Porin subfamily protein n=1 Tax=Novipirellula artificiosorum TaxID=2528016 RepID=A0A5C6D6Z1_9BACT|nr:hypothetical protein Poly41_61510 [Novipirellula artificiosorum]
MHSSGNRQFWRVTAAVSILLILCDWVSTAKAQAPVDPSTPAVQELHREIDKLKQQVRELEFRGTERQAWEDSITKRLPAIDDALLEVRIPSTDYQDAGASPCDADQPLGCAARSCHCGCCPCQCPQPEAPCIDCPRVSTLNPYFNVSVFGALKADVLFNTARPISPGTPYLLLPKSPRGLDEATFDTHARQSTLGAVVTGPQIGDWQTGGTLLAMFYNDNLLADQYGFLPLLAYGELKNRKWRFAAGLQFDVFNPGLPTVLPFAGLSGSGNSGNSFRGQVRLERFLNPSEDVQWTIQTALSEPIASTIDPLFRLLSEDNGWPNVELRVAVGLGALGPDQLRPFELGLSGVVGQLRSTPPAPGNRVVADVWGVGTDLRWKINAFFGVAGEGYVGQTLGTYSGGVLQTVNVDTLEGIRSAGGWLEVFCFWTPCLHSHVGYGIDDPIDRDVSLTGPVRNETYFSNLLWDVTQSVRFGFEFTWRETAYQGVLRDNEGAGFHTQFQWSF